MDEPARRLRVPRGSWHARWYHHWLRLGGRLGFKENLWHYAWVLIFWAPLRWLAKGRILAVPAWAAALATLTLGFIGLSLYIWKWPTLQVLMSLGIVVGCLVVVFLIAFSILLLPNGHRGAAKTTIRTQLRAAGSWYIGRQYLPWLTPFQVSILLGIAIIVQFFPIALAVLGLATIGIGLFVGLIVGLVKLVRRLMRRHPWMPRRLAAAVAYVANKKGSSINPFIEFD